MWHDPSDILRTEVVINLEVNWLRLYNLAHFYNESKARYDDMFVLTLVF